MSGENGYPIEINFAYNSLYQWANRLHGNVCCSEENYYPMTNSGDAEYILKHVALQVKDDLHFHDVTEELKRTFSIWGVNREYDLFGEFNDYPGIIFS
jgi:hypothetical protein